IDMACSLWSREFQVSNGLAAAPCCALVGWLGSKSTDKSNQEQLGEIETHCFYLRDIAPFSIPAMSKAPIA
ncbi:hypothetical protein ACI2KS_12890, partial [Pseudomonas sp. NPDC087358]|uniref:hypothetical protein n=1 Tax=Pseudomonas sp. NPDC087358 TaxID=3364439 RepID=UPI00384ADBF6